MAPGPPSPLGLLCKPKRLDGFVTTLGRDGLCKAALGHLSLLLPACSDVLLDKGRGAACMVGVEG